MSKFKVDISGIDSAMKLVAQYPERVAEASEKAVSETALKIQSGAVRRAPVNDGALRQGIQIEDHDRLGVIDRSVAARVSYAAYVEFGTRSLVRVPPELESYAAQFMGKTGRSFDDLLKMIKEWCRKKNIPSEAAYPIAMKIVKVGVRPQPFLFPAYFEERGKLVERIKKYMQK